MNVKRTIAYLFSWAAILTVGAQPRSAAQALSAAQAFLGGSSVVAKAPSRRDVPLTLAYSRKAADTGDALYYVFDVADGSRGFVVVSGDSLTEPVLAYSPQGRFVPGSLPCNVAWWADECARYVEAVVRSGVAARAPEVQREAVAPLTESRWSQASPFNDLCPAHCPAGCVAVAMAQIMYYHQWPRRGTGSHAYQWNNRTLAADFGATVYDWSQMQPYYGTDYTAEAADAVSTLVSHCGISVDMDYAPAGSGSLVADARMALMNYFGYDRTAAIQARENVDMALWEDLLYRELRCGQPVLYSGTGPEGGHAFVLDGYAEGGLFHFNWGWGGDFDGYYSLLSLTPDTHEYTQSQVAVYGIRPPAEAVRQGDFLLRPTYGDEVTVEACYAAGGTVAIPPTAVIGEKRYDVVAIAPRAFYATAAERVEVPASIVSIGDSAFACAPQLRSVCFADGEAPLALVRPAACFAGSGVEQVYWGRPEVPDGFMSDCASLTTVSLGPSVAAIGTLPFERCDALQTLLLPGGSSHFAVSGGALFTADMAQLVLCPDVQARQFELPAQVDSVRPGAFHLCRRLTAVSVAPGSRSFSATGGCLYSADGRRLLLVPGGQTGRTTIAQGVGTVAPYAVFRTQIDTLVLPSSTAVIAEQALVPGDALTHLYLLAATPPDAKLASVQTLLGRTDFTLHVPQGSRRTYMRTTPWYQMKKIVETGEDELQPAKGEVVYGAEANDDLLRRWGIVSGKGVVKPQTYDVAIHIADPSLVGTTITRLLIPFVDADGLSDVRVWLSRQLALSDKANAPDVCSQTVTPRNGWMEIALDEPYTITAEGVYAGYSLTNSEDAPEPICLVPGTDPGLYWIHTSSTYRQWRDQAADGELSLAMNVVIENVAADRAGLAPLDVLTVQADRPADYVFALRNHGSTPVVSIDYAYQVGTLTDTLHCDFGQPLAARFNQSRPVTLSLPPLMQAGNLELTVRVLRVNGVENTDPTAEATTQAMVYQSYPRHRVVVEEYTGTWCGNCPRGFVGMEKMQRLYPDDFIGISYHNNDPMMAVAPADYPWDTAVLGAFPGYPSATIERRGVVDPYTGVAGSGFHLDEAWLSVREDFAPADIYIDASFADAAQTVVGMTATVAFPLDVDDHHYRLQYVLTADSLQGQGSGWAQANYYAGASMSDPDMDVFTKGADAVEGLAYNFVAVAWSGRTPLPQSLPAAIKGLQNGGAPVTHTYQMDIGQNTLVQDKDRLTAIVLLVDTETGFVVNAAKTRVQTHASQGIGPAAAGAGQAQVYGVDGRRRHAMSKGINIVRRPDGTVVKRAVR